MSKKTETLTPREGGSVVLEKENGKEISRTPPTESQKPKTEKPQAQKTAKADKVKEQADA